MVEVKVGAREGVKVAGIVEVEKIVATRVSTWLITVAGACGQAVKISIPTNRPVNRSSRFVLEKSMGMPIFLCSGL
jgi:hypothetical protein